MARLRSLAPVVGRLGSTLPLQQRDGHGHSRTAEPWRGWYSLARWRELKARVHLRDLFRCQQPGCGVLISQSRDRIADHVQPHRGDPVLFWDDGNVTTLCKPCHDRTKQAEERRAALRGEG